MKKTILVAAVAALVGAAGALALTDRTPRAEAGWSNGVAVRGHWTIEVREPDGALVERREFDNAFVDGDNVAARLLAGTASQGWLGIVLGGGAPPCTANDVQQPCKILPAGAMHNFAAATVFTNLETTVTDHEVAIRGHIIANSAGSVSTVGTLLTRCDADVTPQACGSAVLPTQPPGIFTNHTLDDAIDVLEDQQVIAEVKVQLTPAQ